MPGSRSWPPLWSTDCAGAAMGGWRSSTRYNVSDADQAALGPFPVLFLVVRAYPMGWVVGPHGNWAHHWGWFNMG